MLSDLIGFIADFSYISDFITIYVQKQKPQSFYALRYVVYNAGF